MLLVPIILPQFAGKKKKSHEVSATGWLVTWLQETNRPTTVNYTPGPEGNVLILGTRTPLSWWEEE